MTNNNALQRDWNDDSIFVPSTQNEKFVSNGNTLKVVVPTTITNDRYGVQDIEMEPNARGPKLHYHKLMDETFIVRDGTLTVLTANDETKAGLGTVIHLPCLTVHSYNNDTDGCIKMTMIFNPGLGREAFFRKMYQMLDKNPGDLKGFNRLYQENDSYALNEQDMIPMR